MIRPTTSALRSAAGAFAAAATAWLPAAASSRPLLAVGAAALAAVLATVVVVVSGHVFSNRLASTTALLATVALSGLGLLIAASGLLARVAPIAVLDALASSWARFLSETAPVSARAELLLVPVVHVWLAGATLALLARTRRPVGWSVAVVLFASGAAVLLAAPQSPGLIEVLAIVAATLALALVHGDGKHGHAGARRHGVPVIAMSVLIAAVVAVLPQPRQRHALRDPDTVPVEEIRGVSPLAELKAALVAQPARTQLLLSNAPADGLVRRATLEHYDGMSWTVEGRFHRTGNELAAADGPAEDNLVGVATTITVSEPLDRWVPTTGRPRSIGGTAFRWNRGSGDLLADRPLDTGAVLHVTAAAVPAAANLSTLTPAAGAELLALTRTDGASEPLVAQLDGLLGGGGSPGERLARAQTEMTQRFAYSTSSPAGHQDGMLAYVLKTSRLGTPEQFAAIGALAARRAGFPARVVVGWKLPPQADPAGDTGAAEEQIPVRTTNAYAWVEIATTDGWRSIDMTPPLSQTEPDAPLESAGTGSSAAAAPQPPDEQGDATILSPGTDIDGGAGLLQTAARAGIRFGVPALLVAVLATIALLKLQRRRLRASAGHPADRVLGAWDELIDRLIETGRPLDPAATPSELAHRLAEQVPDAAPAVAELAPLVDRAIHAPDLVAYDAANDAWAHCRTASTALVRHHCDLRHPYRPIIRPFDPRPLVRNRVHRS